MSKAQPAGHFVPVRSRVLLRRISPVGLSFKNRVGDRTDAFDFKFYACGFLESIEDQSLWPQPRGLQPDLRCGFAQFVDDIRRQVNALGEPWR